MLACISPVSTYVFIVNVKEGEQNRKITVEFVKYGYLLVHFDELGLSFENLGKRKLRYGRKEGAIAISGAENFLLPRLLRMLSPTPLPG